MSDEAIRFFERRDAAGDLAASARLKAMLTRAGRNPYQAVADALAAVRARIPLTDTQIIQRDGVFEGTLPPSRVWHWTLQLHEAEEREARCAVRRRALRRRYFNAAARRRRDT